MKRGFTLVELLIVIIIIGVLATMAVPQYQKLVDRAKRVEAITMLSSIGTASMMYYMQQGMPSTTISTNTKDLYVAVPSNSKWVYRNTTNVTTGRVDNFQWLAANENTTAWIVAMKVDMPDGVKTFYEKKNNNSSTAYTTQITDIITP